MNTEDKLQSFPIGGQIPLTIRLSPLAKVKVFRISAQLEQKTSYFASGESLVPPSGVKLSSVSLTLFPSLRLQSHLWSQVDSS